MTLSVQAFVFETSFCDEGARIVVGVMVVVTAEVAITEDEVTETRVVIVDIATVVVLEGEKSHLLLLLRKISHCDV